MVLLKTSDTMLATGHTWDSPLADICLRIPLERLVLHIRTSKRRLDGRIILHRRNEPRLRSVAKESLCKKKHRSHMLKSNLRSIESSIETACWRMSCHNDHRTLTVTAIQSLIEVGLLGLGRDTGRRTCTLHIHNHKRKFSHDCKTHSLGLQGKSRTRSSGHSKITCEGRTDCSTDTCDFILSLNCLCPKALMNCKLF